MGCPLGAPSVVVAHNRCSLLAPDRTRSHPIAPPNSAGHQGGPHNHTITALATALKQATSPEFLAYQEAVLSNSQAFAKAMTDR